MMHGREKSDLAIVAEKPANKDARVSAEPVEPRAGAEGNTVEADTHRTLSRARVSHGLDRVRQAARENRTERFTALLHHVTIEALRQAYLGLQPEAAAGVDGVTWRDYGQDLERKLADLHARVHRGAYRAQPSRRHYIPKPDGRRRPLGIAALEDKILQRAVVRVLNAIYEEDFLGFSYGYRPGRSQHDALDALYVGISRTKVNWILDADIAGFFDAVSHDWLVRFIEHRVGDRRVIRLIRKWLTAGVMEDGVVSPSEVGTPQGAVASPLLANIYLHYVFDLWAERWRRREATGNVILVRYADDLIVGFEHRADAERFWADLRARLAQFALSLHPSKTRLIRFGRHAAAEREQAGEGKPETFDFLGFTHICGRSRRGGFRLQRRTRRDRKRAQLRAVKDELRRRMLDPIPAQGRWLRQVVGGYFAYHAVPTNFAALASFRHWIKVLWLRTLRRRSPKDRTVWERMKRIADQWLPRARILHPWPNQRFAAKHPRWEPDARIGHVRFCAGGGQ